VVKSGMLPRSGQVGRRGVLRFSAGSLGIFTI